MKTVWMGERRTMRIRDESGSRKEEVIGSVEKGDEDLIVPILLPNGYNYQVVP